MISMSCLKLLTRNKSVLKHHNYVKILKNNITIYRTIQEYREYRKSLLLSDKKVGFVPTMGALHSGHMSLVQESKKHNDITVVSIFVNPTQFSVGEDLDKYPRTFEKDFELLSKYNIDAIFYPLQSDMYPNSGNTDSNSVVTPLESLLCYVEPKQFSNISEGIARPDFFRGVATVVNKLFNIIEPTNAYFGQKDISQCILIKKMVQDFNINTNIVICETIRELDGLALSSRNTYLTETERSKAKILFQALLTARSFCEGSKQIINRQEIIDKALNILKGEELVTKVEYISVASHENMKELNNYDPAHGCVLSSAIRIGNVRLIDNLLVGKAYTDILGAH